ncbi:uncharacterized protein [Periplaneta americana]|uniref:uncharacterized protein isoform X4 n=1 Tax=Periplaneta americana TaxID=6978 RepID=UPI0037E7CBB9
MQIFPLLITEMELEVVLDDMKVKCEVDPLALPKNDTNGEESLSLHIDRPRVKIECKDPTFDLDPVVQCDEKTPVSVSFSALKSETQDGNLMLQHVDGIKMNYEDSSNTFASEVKFDRAAPPVPFDTVKCEPEESCDVNIIKEEMLDVKTEDDDSSNRITPLHCHDTVQIEVEDCSTSAGQTNCLECAQL